MTGLIIFNWELYNVRENSPDEISWKPLLFFSQYCLSLLTRTESAPPEHDHHTQQYHHEKDKDDNTNNKESRVGLDDTGYRITFLLGIISISTAGLLDLDVDFPGQSPPAPDFGSDLTGPAPRVTRPGSPH